MDIYQIRRENLQQIIREKHNGKIADMVDNTRWSHSQISRWAGLKSENFKQMGRQVAAEIEIKYKKPPGWMDQDHRQHYVADLPAEYSAWPFKIISQQRIEKLTRKELYALEQSMEVALAAIESQRSPRRKSA